MNRREWVSLARAAAERHARTQPGTPAGHGIRPEPERALLAEIHRLILAAPLALLDSFRNRPEQNLTDRVEARIDAIWEGRFDWAAGSADAEAWLAAAIEQIRALDQAIAEGLSDLGHGPRDPRHWEVPEHGAYVIPRSPYRLDGTAPKQGEPYSRRGLRFHTILPTEVRGFRVVPVPVSTGPLPGGQLKFGAALFQQAVLSLQAADERPGSKRFLVTGFAAADAHATLLQQAGAAFSDGCFAVVWPELTMPPGNRQALVTTLAIEALRHGPDRPLRVVVAGSWHEPNYDGKRANVSHILGRTGELLCSYTKFTAFHDHDWGEEAIIRGEELPIVVADDLVIGFAICKDFCDRAVASPFAELPVDLMLIPSMGSDATMAGHLANAEDLRLRTGTLVFVVQQLSHSAAQSGSAPPLGHILLSQGKAAPVPQHTTWSVHTASTRPAKP